MTGGTARKRVAGALLVASVVGGVLTVERSVAASGTDATIAGSDVADAYTSQSKTTHNYGSQSTLQTNNSAYRTYLRFTVSGIPSGSTITGVSLHIRATRSSSSGFNVVPLTSQVGTWGERSINWSNQPSVSTTVYGSRGAISGAQWLDVPLSNSPVTGNGTYDFALIGAGASTVQLGSRESSTDPVLNVTVPSVAPGLTSPPVPPKISGSATDGSVLSVTKGSYTGLPAPTVTDTWQTCLVDSGGNITSCSNVGTGSSYTVRSSDVGNRIQVSETASNSAGSTGQTSAPTAIVAAVPPTNSSPPSISGQPVQGQTLTASPGTWSGTAPIQFSYKWFNCPSSGSCSAIPNATNTTYTVASTDVGDTLQVQVTGSNTAGSKTVSSANTAVVTSSGGSGSDPVIASAGDIACDPSSSNYNGGNGNSNACREKYTAALLAGIPNLGAVLPLGDNAYYCGSIDSFNQSYQPTWGQFMSITHPTVGNHEYLTSGGTGCTTDNAGAAGYFSYFGSRAGTSAVPYYSWNIGTWHMISLDTNCSDAGGCSTTSPQGKWLASDLAANHSQCTLAYWHIPLYSSGGRSAKNSQSMWNQLYNAGADVVLTGHDHTYERFAPQDANGNAVSNGIVEFVVGTGGANHTSLASTAANSVVFNDTTFGVLKMTLHPTSYDWQFIPDKGSGSWTGDSGSANCH